MFSSAKCAWETPQYLFTKYNNIFRFDLDVCALPENAQCADYFTPEKDGLQQEWYGCCWMNPPYGRAITAWIKKAYDEVQKGNAKVVVCLLPARTDTKWFHDYCTKGRITFLRGRVKFGGCKYNAPFPSMVVIFGNE